MTLPSNLSFKFYKYFLLSLLFALLLPSAPVKAQVNKPQAEKPARILFLVDASGSMSNDWHNDKSRFKVASEIVVRIMDSVYVINPGVAFALRAFGADFPAKDSNCTDTKLEVPFAFQNRDQIAARLSWLRPKGFSPIALSLKEAAEKDFIKDDKYAYSIILVTDGGESCGGDICATVENLLNKKISFKPYIITLVDYEPLRKAYDCLGNVLTVAKENQIAPAVEKIVNDNRKILSVKSIATNTLLKKSPPLKPATPPQVKPHLPDTKPLPSQKEIPVAPPVVVKPEPKVVAPPVVASMDNIFQLSQPRRANLLFTLPSPKAIDLRNLPVLVITLPDYNIPTISPEKVKPSASRPAKRPVVSNKVETVPFYITANEAAKTTVQVYFTDGKGTFFYTQPLIEILDHKTGKAIKKLTRTLSGKEPVPIPISGGVYDIIIPGSRSKAINVQLEEHKDNKVYIKAGLGSLIFEYSTDPDRPVKEYTAYVSDRFGTRKVTIQPCDTILPYPAANYHIEINTLPKLVYNVDLDFNQLKVATIPTPGTFQILNTRPMEQVQLWHQLGNEYVPFLNMQITGNPTIQQVKLLPGLYQARYFKAPHKPYAVSIIIPFQIKSESKTSITLEN